MARDDTDSSSEENATSWFARVRTWLAPPLDAELTEQFASDMSARNRRWLLAVAPLVAVGHVIHVAVFHMSAEARATMPPEVVRWRDSLALVHGVTVVLMVSLGLAAFRWGQSRNVRLLGPAAVALYLLHGAAISYVDQTISAVNGVGPFTGYCLFFAVLVTLTPRVSLAVYAAGAVTFTTAIVLAQPSSSLRMALIPNGVSITVVSVALSWILYATRRRDFAQRTTILRQRAQLSTMNQELELRVKEQVAEIVNRVEEVDRLNAQLSVQVRTRSTELSFALAKLAQQRERDGSLRPGALLAERFEILELLGEGGMGVVYAGVDRTTGMRVAIKVVQASSTWQLDALHRFLREAKTGATVVHPAIVRALHLDISDDGMLFQVQELVSGTTLHAASGAENAWQPSDAARIVSVLCDALAAAHEQGVIHRDVKPANVMLTSVSPGVKLLDFGLAKLYERHEGNETSKVTRTGAILGTPAFMAPEQLEGMVDAGAPADVYSVGIMLFVLLTGAHPFEDETLHGLLYNHLCVVPPNLRTLSPTIPLVIADLVARCLAKEPNERPTAATAATILKTYAEEVGAPLAHVIAQRRQAAVTAA